MPQICPKCAYERKQTDAAVPDWQCPACGIAYAKFVAPPKEEAPAVAATAEPESKPAVEAEEPPEFEAKSRGNFLKIAAPALVLLVVLVYVALRSGSAPEKAAKPALPAAVAASSTVEPIRKVKRSEFENIHWGADEATILATLGTQVERLATTETFKNAHADLAIPHYLMGGVDMRAVFQMSNTNNQLARVVLSKHSTDPQQRAFANDFSTLSAHLSQRFGAGKRLGEFKQQWISGDTVILLDDFYQEGVFENLTLLYRPYDE